MRLAVSFSFCVSQHHKQRSFPWWGACRRCPSAGRGGLCTYSIQNTQGSCIVVARFGPWARELSTPNQSSTVWEVVEVIHLGRSTCHWGLDLTVLERAQRTVIPGAVSTATVGHTVRRLRRVRGCQSLVLL